MTQEAQEPVFRVDAYEKLHEVFGGELVELGPGSKAPVRQGWPAHQPTLAELRSWAARKANVGLKTSKHPAVDVDVADPALAAAFRVKITSLLGAAPIRTRSNSAKFAALYIAAEPYQKRKSTFVRGSGAQVEKCVVEVLCDGQQIHIFGKHPSGVMVEWDSGTPQPSTSITMQQVDGCLAALVPIAASQGWTLVQNTSGTGRRQSVDQSGLLAPSIEALTDASGYLPNDGAFDDRDAYLAVLVSHKGGAGQEHESEALDLVLAWAAKWEGVNDPEVVKRDFDSLRPPFSLGWDYLREQAKRGGFDSAAYDFEVSESEPASVREAREGARWALTASAHAQIASLHQSAERAVLLAAQAARGTEILTTVKELQSSAQRQHPHRAAFRAVCDAADTYQRHISNRVAFDRFVDEKAQNNAAYKQLSPDVQRLLLDAAWALLAPSSLLIGREATQRPRPQQPEKLSRRSEPELIERLLPASGVVTLIGDSGSGKSQVIAALLSSIATTSPDPVTGEPENRFFRKRKISGNPSALYLGSEAIPIQAGRFELQVQHETGLPASQQAHGIRMIDGVWPLDNPVVALLSAFDAIQAMEAEGVPAPAIIVIDVLRAAMRGDENASGDADFAMATAHLLARTFGVLVLLVHHTTKGQKSARGSGAIKANADVELLMEKVGEKNPTYRLTVTKNKSGLEGDTFEWHIPAEDAPLTEGEAPPRSGSGDSAKVSEQCAAALGRIIRKIASAQHGVPRTALSEAAHTESPELFPRTSTGRGRITRGLQESLNTKYVAYNKGKYWVGPETPPLDTTLSASPAKLDDLEAAR